MSEIDFYSNFATPDKDDNESRTMKRNLEANNPSIHFNILSIITFDIEFHPLSSEILRYFQRINFNFFFMPPADPNSA